MTREQAEAMAWRFFENQDYDVGASDNGGLYEDVKALTDLILEVDAAAVKRCEETAPKRITCPGCGRAWKRVAGDHGTPVATTTTGTVV